MMQDLWDYCKSKHVDQKKTIHFFLICNTLIFAFAGLMLWMIIRLFLFDNFTGLLCFVGYPAVLFGIFGGAFYLMRQEN